MADIIPIPIGAKFQDLTGTPHGKLTVLGYTGPAKPFGGMWLCKCECGTQKLLPSSRLCQTRLQSCGCGMLKSMTTHGKYKTPEYSTWQAMLQRCTNPNATKFPQYGGRGIRVCSRWRLSFIDFLEDVGTRPSRLHTIDRFPDKAGNYEPGNVRWATPKEQQRNIRTNRILELHGERKPVAEWAEITGINSRTIFYRLQTGWSDERTLTEPVHSQYRRKLDRTQ